MDFKNFKISFCIVCMNRLHQLKETLLQNIADNQDYEELEFVLLDYNSQDGLEEWVKTNLGQFLQQKRLKYFKTAEPMHFWHSHAKNLAFHLASGDIVCNINADHFTGKGFAAYVNNSFNENKDIVLTTIDYFNTRPDYRPPKDVYGKVCLLKEDFLRVRGFDEEMKNYGFEDWDFINRLELAGLTRRFIDNLEFLKFIVHHEEERFTLKNEAEKVKSIFVNYINPAESAILALYHNYTFARGILTDDSVTDSWDYRRAYTARTNRYNNSVKDNYLEKGQWTDLDNAKLTLWTLDGGKDVFDVEGKKLKSVQDNSCYYLLDGTEHVYAIAEFLFFFENRKIMEDHLVQNVFKVNPFTFGDSILLEKQKGGEIV